MQLRDKARFRDFLTEDNIESLYKLAPLHDIGKVGIPDAILLKKGKLTPEEFEIMKTHPLLGGNAIAMAENGLPTPNRFLHIAREIATGHHEKWDGSGYPLGLKGDEIPISARLMALADVYDALISRRIYKKAFTHEESVAHILLGRGTHFDPEVVDAFLVLKEEFRQIAEQYQD
jgi:putative two-component system response regulator